MDRELEALVSRARAGDRAAFGALYERLAPKIYAFFVYKLRGDTTTAEDLTEDVFLRALRALEEYEARGLPFTAWLYRVAQNRLIDHIRWQQRRPRLLLDAAEQTPDSFAQRALGSVLDRAELIAALASLPRDQRRVVCLRFLHALSLAETAAAMARGEESVRKLQRRALVALRRWLEGAALRAAG